MLNVLDLFSGIGGFSLGLERTGGFQTKAFCEIEPNCRKVLAKHWPNIPIHNDIKQLDGAPYAGTIDLICGGYPCQPFSSNGERLGEADPRQLWPEMRRIVRQVRPRWVVAENVRGHVTLGFDSVATQMEGDGFTVWPFLVPASAIGLPQGRERLWIVAHSPDRELIASGTQRHVRHDEDFFSEEAAFEWVRCRDGKRRLVKPGLPLLVSRISNRVAQIRLWGNTVIPQIPEMIGKTIIAYERQLAMAA